MDNEKQRGSNEEDIVVPVYTSCSGGDSSLSVNDRLYSDISDGFRVASPQWSTEP